MTKKILLILVLLLMIQSVCAKEYIDYSQKVYLEDSNYRVEIRVTGIASETVEQFISKYPSNIVFVIDTSGSMETLYNGKSRLNWAIEKSKELMNVFQNNSNVGMVGFSDDAVIIKAFTPVSELSKSTLTTPKYGGGTCIGCGLDKGIELLKNYPEKRPSYIILLTDGKNTGSIDPVEVARKGAVPIYAVSIGEKDEIDSDLLTNIASSSGGAYIHVTEIDKLKTKIQELIIKTKKISGQNIRIGYTPSKDMTIDIKTISVTAGNMETGIKPVSSHEISSTGIELLKVFAPQLSPRDEFIIQFSAVPKKEVSSLGTVTLSAKDPEKEIDKEYDLKVTPQIKLEMNVDYPDTIYYAVSRDVNVTLKNPSDTEVTIKPDLQPIGDVQIIKKPDKTVQISARSGKTLTWELKSKEPKKDKVILLLKISGDNIIEPDIPEKEIQMDYVYKIADDLANKIKYYNMILIGGILFLIVGLAMIGISRIKENEINSEYNNMTSSLESILRKCDRLEPSAAKIKLIDAIKDEINKYEKKKRDKGGKDIEL